MQRRQRFGGEEAEDEPSYTPLNTVDGSEILHKLR